MCQFKKGDFVCFKKSAFPVQPEDVLLVRDIQELHWLCKDNTPSLKPRPIELIDREGTIEWTHWDDLILVTDKRLHFDTARNQEVPPASPI